MAELIPQPLESLLRRLLADLGRGGSILGLPCRSIWRARPGLDLSVTLPGGARAASPVGPAAGPHTQLAPNIVVAWLAGARVIELKTIQVRDRLEIPRPCIDAPGLGYNVEWSQELRLEDSARQYAIAWLLVHLLAGRGIAGSDGHPGVVFDGSVGYDLAGVRSPGVAKFLDTMRDAGTLLAQMRAGLPPALRAAADLDVPPAILETVTLSTFHGCPPAEIEGMAEHLFERHHLNVVVKLNPTLLGHHAVRTLLHERLGYTHLALDPAAFDSDLAWDAALPMLERLSASAARHGRALGVKFTNTLIVRNPHRRLEGEVVYLSGPPLHVLAVTLAHKFVEATDRRIPISFSSGLDADNVADTVACGFAPVTTCTDLLQPPGYRRLPRYLKALEAALEGAGAASLAELTQNRSMAPPLGARAAAAASSEPAAESARAVSPAARANLAAYAARVAADPKYRAVPEPATAQPRAPLPAIDCDSCNNCVLVCPNGAFFSLPTPPAALAAGRMKEERQYVLFADACNACGHCDTFCPQEGGPHLVKPRFGTGCDGLVAEGVDAPTLRELGDAARAAGVPIAEGAAQSRGGGTGAFSPGSSRLPA